jgi:hypothetical protein
MLPAPVLAPLLALVIGLPACVREDPATTSSPRPSPTAPPVDGCESGLDGETALAMSETYNRESRLLALRRNGLREIPPPGDMLPLSPLELPGGQIEIGAIVTLAKNRRVVAGVATTDPRLSAPVFVVDTSGRVHVVDERPVERCNVTRETACPPSGYYGIGVTYPPPRAATYPVPKDFAGTFLLEYEVSYVAPDYPDGCKPAP